MKEVEEGTRVKESYNRSEVKTVVVPEDLRLSREDLMSSFTNDLFRIPFANENGDVVFPVNVRKHNGTTLVIELQDGGTFQIAVSEIEYK